MLRNYRERHLGACWQFSLNRSGRGVADLRSGLAAGICIDHFLSFKASFFGGGTPKAMVSLLYSGMAGRKLRRGTGQLLLLFLR